MKPPPEIPLVAIACGGTGGHVFPGLAIGEELQARGTDVLYLVSTKEVDRQALRGTPGEAVVALPAVGLSGRNWAGFLRGFLRAWRVARQVFRTRPPAAVLSMGGFTSAPPVLAGRGFRAATFLHEANAIPGRANRWLAHVVDEAFVNFPDTAGRLWTEKIRAVGMPVRTPFRSPPDPVAARAALGLRPDEPVLLITGGSQGARGLNELVLRALPLLRLFEPRLQFLHLTGEADLASTRQAYAAQRIPALVRPFLTEMDLALGAATAVVARAGASSLGEIAALGVPPILVPLPTAADNHQYYNARAVADPGAARLLPQAEATPEKLVWTLRPLLHEGPERTRLLEQLARWHKPDAADAVAEAILARFGPLPWPASPRVAAAERAPRGTGTGPLPHTAAPAPQS